MCKNLSVFLSVSLACLFASSLRAAQADLAAADWSVKSPHSLATNPPSDEAEVAFLNKLGYMLYTGVCLSRFVDLRHSGNLSLVVSASNGGSCYLQIIDKTPSGFELYGVDLGQYSRDFEIEDLAGNGDFELIVDTDFTAYLGHTGPCVATWPVIYAWTGSGYTDVSSQYQGYYEQKLKSLKKQIAATSSATEQAQAPAAGQTGGAALAIASVPAVVTVTSSSSSGGIPAGPYVLPAPVAVPSPATTPAATLDLRSAYCTEAEVAKIERFLGISPDAGMVDAIKWANSDDPNRREFACYVLQDIGTADAIEYLRTLSNDSDRTVARIAKRSLRAVGKGRPLNTIDRAEIEQPVAGSPPK